MKHAVKTYLIAARAYSFPASIIPVVFGAAYAFHTTRLFSFVLFLLSLIAGVLYHSACNMLNDYYDHKFGVDRAGTFGGSGLLVDGTFTPHQFLVLSLFQFAAGTLIGLYLVYLRGVLILLIGAAGLGGAVFYTAGRSNAKYHAAGEPLVFVMMGVLMVAGAYAVQTGEISLNCLLASLPVSFMVTAILQANDTRDIADDRESGITTLSTLLGPKGARVFLYLLLLLTYAALGALVQFSVLPPLSLLAALTLPMALRLINRFVSVPDEKSPQLLGSVEYCAKLHFALGLLLTLGVALS
jgi:1,4-dihydroxy-2-naphthoate polyprenyltransferase